MKEKYGARHYVFRENEMARGFYEDLVSGLAISGRKIRGGKNWSEFVSDDKVYFLQVENKEISFQWGRRISQAVKKPDVEEKVREEAVA